LTQYALPKDSTLQPATRAEAVPALAPEWRLTLSDRIVGLKPAEGKLTVLTHANEWMEVSANGTIGTKRLLNAESSKQVEQELRTVSDPAQLAQIRKEKSPGRLVKFVVPNQEQTAVAYWGGRVEVLAYGKTRSAHHFQQDVTAIAWLGQKLLIGDADGQVICCTPAKD